MYRIGVDLGGTNIAAGIVNDEGKISCIRTSENTRYHFRLDEAWHPAEEEEDADAVFDP